MRKYQTLVRTIKSQLSEFSPYSYLSEDEFGFAAVDGVPFWEGDRDKFFVGLSSNII